VRFLNAGEQTGEIPSATLDFFERTGPDGVPLLRHPMVIDPIYRIIYALHAAHAGSGRDVNLTSIGGVTKMTNQSESVQQRLMALTADQETAMAQGDHIRAKQLDAEIFALAGQQGDGPIVGGTDYRSGTHRTA